jgi:hypothetical protein
VGPGQQRQISRLDELLDSHLGTVWWKRWEESYRSSELNVTSVDIRDDTEICMRRETLKDNYA